MLAVRSVVGLMVCAGAAAAQQAAAQEKAPSVDQALALRPIQRGVEFDTPTGADAKACAIKPQREGKSTSWIVTNPDGSTLRRFADTNADNMVDTWCYYQNGLEVYRDIDSDFDGRADQYRWFHTGGSRWGLDDDQDSKIDRWRKISPQEVAEEAVAAVLARDADRFERLVVSAEELKSLGAGKELTGQIDEQRKQALSAFKALARSQKAITAKSRFVDFGAPRPGVIPAGVDGSKRDVTVYENASALIDNDGAPEQLLLGSIIQVGDSWRLVEAPRLGEGGPTLANVFSIPTSTGAPTAATGEAPNEQLQKLIAQLEKLDQQSATATPQQLSKLTGQRVAIIEKLAASSTTKEEALQWYTQLADLLSSAAQSDGYTQAVTKLAQLEKSPAVKTLGQNLIAHIAYRKIGAQQGLAYSDPKADYEKIQEKWIADLEAFVKAYPQSPDAAEAMLQLGSMAGEFAGKADVAERWYRQVAAEFPSSPSGKKAAGALRRLGSIGKSLALGGETLRGGKVNLSAAPYRGKFVLVHYWATWSDPSADMTTIESLKKKYRGKLEVLGVNLDSSVGDARSLVAKQRTSWRHLFDEGGLEGARAESMGVMTLPLMMLVDNQGRVVNRDLHSSDLEQELQRVIR